MLGLAAGCKTPLTAPPADRPPVPILSVPHAKSPPIIDGRLDENAWASAAVIPALLPCRGENGANLTNIPTTIRLLWDRTNLYVGVECVDNDLYLSGRMQHDGYLHEEDVFEVFLDGKGDGQQSIEVQINADNVTCDIMSLVTAPVQCTRDLTLTEAILTWNAWSFREWTMAGMQTAALKTVRDGKTVGWTAELALPAFWIARRCGLREFRPMDLRANFVRMDWQPDPRTGIRRMVEANWSPTLRGCPHISPWAMGILRLAN